MADVVATRGEGVVEWRTDRGARLMSVLGNGAFAALMGALAIGSVVVVATGSSPAFLLGLLVYAPGAYLSGWRALRIWRATVRIDSTSVLVANPWRTERVPLKQVERFEAAGYGTASAAVWLVRTAEGRARAGPGPRGRTLLWVTQRGGTVFTVDSRVKALEPLAAQMNRALEQARAPFGDAAASPG